MSEKLTKNSLTPEDKVKLLAAVADLPFVHRTPKTQDYMRDLMLTTLDFHMRAEVVGKAINYFRDRVQPVHAIHTHGDLTETLARYADTQEGNTEASLFLWNNRHWQRVHLLRGLLEFFSSIDVTDQSSLRTWARMATFEKNFQGKVKGLGLAVFQWLLIRMGVPTIKPDVWVIAFAERITGKKIADKVLVDLFNEISPLVGQSMTTIDMTIWAFERMGMGTNDLPGLRMVWWRIVWKRIEEQFKEDEVFSKAEWGASLDGPARLRYDQAGIRASGMLRWSGDEAPVETLLTLMQNPWRERFRILLTVSREQPADGIAAELKARFEAEGWVVTGDEHVQLAMDMNTELFMQPTLSIDVLLEQADLMALKAVAGLKAIVASTHS